MSDRIIGLYGHGDCGKSETLNYLKEMLRDEGISISLKPHPWSEKPETFKYKGKVVCVAPGGDTISVLLDNIEYFKEKNCDVAITATRCKGDTVKVLREYASSDNIVIEWVQKSYEYNLSKETHSQCNLETAKVIFGLL